MLPNVNYTIPEWVDGSADTILAYRKRNLVIPYVVQLKHKYVQAKSFIKPVLGNSCFGRMKAETFYNAHHVEKIVIGVQHLYSVHDLTDFRERVANIDRLISWLISREGPFRHLLYSDNGSQIFSVTHGLFSSQLGDSLDYYQKYPQEFIDTVKIENTRVNVASVMNFLMAIRNTWQFYNYITRPWNELVYKHKVDKFTAYYIVWTNIFTFNERGMLCHGNFKHTGDVHITSVPGAFEAGYKYLGVSPVVLRKGDIPNVQANHLFDTTQYSPCNVIWTDTRDETKRKIWDYFKTMEPTPIAKVLPQLIETVERIEKDYAYEGLRVARG